VYVNDLPDWIVNDMRMFADDTKLWSKIIGLSDCVRIQADLDQLSIWSDKWLLSFNPDKCKVMRVGHSYRFHCSLQQDNTSHRLLETKEETDLGILVTDRLSVSSPCAEAAKKAMKVLDIIRS